MSAVTEPQSALGSREDAPAGVDAVAPVTEPPAESPQLPELELREPLPAVIETQDALGEAADRLASGTGPIALDTERASGYRYGQRAYLIQARREGAGTVLIDPIAVPDLSPLVEVLTGPEWILHAASQDLPCLAELGMHPSVLFDTELAGRLLGMERVGLAPMVAAVFGKSLRKGHGAADWSTRPLPQAWLEYAALDVEVLIELREQLSRALDEAGKLGWAQEEFAAIRDAPAPEPRVEPWRRTSGLHKARGRRSLAIVAGLWHERDRIAREKDMAPGRLLPDSSLVAAAVAQPRDVGALLALPGFKGRGAARHRAAWGGALDHAWALPESQLPAFALRGGGPPPPRQWAQRDPLAAKRLDRAREELRDVSDRLQVPVENLIQPDLVRRLIWGPSAVTEQDVAQWLRQNGARSWQVGLTAPLLAAAIESA